MRERKKPYNLSMMKKQGKFLAAAIVSAFIMNAQAQNIFDNYSKKSVRQFISENEPYQIDNRQIQASTVSSVNSDLIHFWEDLKTDVFDSVCKNAELKLNQDAKIADVAGIEGKFKRYLKQFPSKKIALIDEIGLKLDVSLGRELIQIPDFGPLNVGIGASLEGKSIVVRPLESDKYCKEMDSLIDLREVKTVLPINAKRISEMKEGEIWKMPVTTRFSFSTGANAPVAAYINVFVGAGVSKERKPSITLFRMNQDTIRLRIRIDRLLVKSVSAGVSSTFEIPASDIGLFEAENILTKEINKQIAREINKYLAAKIVYGHSRSSGRKILLEFLINPKDQRQLDALVSFLKGDLGYIKRFIELGLKFNEFTEAADVTQGLNGMNQVVNEAEDALGVDASFAGANHYHGHSDNLNIAVPVIHNHENSWTTSYNRYQSMNTKDGVMHVSQAGRVSNGSSINIPFVGTMIKYNSDKNVYIINKETERGASDPVLLFQHNVGFVRQGEGTARDIIHRINNVLKYAGVNGDGTTDELVLPVDNIFPASPLPEGFDPFEDTAPSKTYKASVVSFRLMFSAEGIKQLIYAPAENLLKAYLNVMRESESELLKKVAHLFKVNSKNVVEYDYKQASKILGVNAFDNDNGVNPLDIMRDMAYTATCLIRDIFSVRDESDWKERSEKLAAVSAGRSKSKMGFEDFFKVAIQLVSKQNISAEVYVHTDKRVKGEKDVTETYSYMNSKDNNFSATIGEVNAMRERFAEPSTLSD